VQFFAAAVVIMGAVCRPAAGQPPAGVQSFTARTTGLNPGAGQTLSIDILRWSTDEESGALATAFKTAGDQGLAGALQGGPSLGYVWVEGQSLGYTVRYARRIEVGAGAERIVIATDRPIGSWGAEPWRAVGPRAREYAFSVVELRIGPKGGEGKASLASPIALDAAAGVIALEDYAAAPVLLTGVKRTPRS
jgi:hypothetical protein